MKKKQFESVCRTMLPDLPGFACKGWLLHAHPVGHVLRGFCCDDSGFDPSTFAVWVFVLPLYVPTTHLQLNFGDRLKDDRGCDKWWNIHEPDLAIKLVGCIQQQGLPFLEAVREPSEIVGLVERLPGNTNPHSLEAIAYSLVMSDDATAAQNALERLTRTLDSSIPWQSEMNDRAGQLARQLRTDPRQAKRQLIEWEHASLRNLGVWEN